MNKPTILIVDDEFSIRESFGLILEDSYNMLLAASGEAALKKIVDEKVHLVYLDIRMPGLDGLETLKRMKEIDDSIQVIMVTAVNDVQKASQAIQFGAKDYVVKPFDVELIRNITNKALGRRELKEEGKKARAEGLREEIEGIIGSSGKIEEIANIIENISGKDMSILLAGEQGTEFELIAKAIHNKSERSSYPLRIIQIEKGGNDFTRSRILGSEQGSSTYTLEKEKGILEVAGAGTLLIKNVENLDTKLQEELADVLREKEIKKEGRSISIPFGARVICSTTSNLKELAASGKFSNKLFGLISESYLDLPPLRERSADIPIFVSYFLEKFNSKYNKEIKGVSKDATEILAGYPWPGNTEELRSVIENLVLTAKEEHIGADLLPIEILLNSSAFFAADEKNKVALEALWSDFEKDYIKNTLERTNFDENKAGTLLGLRSMALKAKLESLGLSKNL